MWFFVQDQNDPIIQTYENAFPRLFTSMARADSIIPGITDHWRYPEDIFTVQSNMYRSYHQQIASVFYTKAQLWAIPQNPASGEVGSATTTVATLPGNFPAPVTLPSVSQSVMPVYELLALPGQTQQSFVLVQPFVPSSSGDKQTLTAFMTASSDPDDYGQLTIYTIPAGQTVDGPYLVSTAVATNGSISQEITLLDQHGSKVVLGSVIMTPIGQSLLYIQPLYVEQVQNGVPRLNDVVVVYNNNAYHSGSGSPSLDGALCNVTNPNGSHPFASYCAGAPATPPTTTGRKKGGSPPPRTVPSTTTTSPVTAPPSTSTSTTLALPSERASLVQDLDRAEQDFAYAEAALRQGDLATYQNDIRAGEALVALATKLATPTGTTTTSRPATTTATTSTSPGTKQEPT
jgi:hypothetical protein